MSSRSLSVLVGTTKGAFLIDGGDDRSGWTVRGPFCGGWPINHVIGDAKSGRLWAGGGSDWQGAGVWRSDDGVASLSVRACMRLVSASCLYVRLCVCFVCLVCVLRVYVCLVCLVCY
jgi:hypothetical protein